MLTNHFSQASGRIATKLAHDGLQVSVHPGCAQGQGQGQRSRYSLGWYVAAGRLVHTTVAQVPLLSLQCVLLMSMPGWVNRLRLNAGKTQLIWLGTRQQLDKLPTGDVQLLSASILTQSVVRDLSFAVNGPRVWNSLPASIRDPSLSLTVFVTASRLCGVCDLERTRDKYSN